MPKKPSGSFDQNKYMNDWKKDHMKMVGASFKSDFVDQFKEACAALGVKQSDVIRQAMTETIQKAVRKSTL